MLFLSICWLIAAALICFGFLLVSAKSFVPNLIPNLYLFGKIRGLNGNELPKNRFLQVPKSWFCHFYLAGIMCNSLVLLSACWTYFYSGHWPGLVHQVMSALGYIKNYNLMSPVPVIIAIVMIEIQVTRRFLECVFINSYSRSTMSIVIYTVGVMYYSFIGISVLCQAQETVIDLNTLSIRWYEIVAVVIFSYASYRQYRVNRIFAKLRQDKNGMVNDVKHHVPHGDLFELCSCPHYLMEIIIYASIASMFALQHEILICVWIFVASNQVISAFLTHSWYRQTFPNYPRDRKALIPYLF